MFDENKIKQWLENTPLKPSGCALLIKIATSPPARAVSGGRVTNVSGHFPSRKNGQTIQYESSTGERSMAIHLEYNDEVLAFWDQPATLPIEITDKNGRRSRTTYTADFLALYADKAVVYEVKPTKKLLELCEQRQHDWHRDDTGLFHYLPAERLYAEMGIQFVVVPNESNSLIRAENELLLLQTRWRDVKAPERTLIRRIHHVFRTERELRITELAKRVGITDLTPILQLIDSKLLYTDLDRSRLSDEKSGWVAASHEHVGLASTGQDLVACYSGTISTDNVPAARELCRIAERDQILSGAVKSKECRQTTFRWRQRLASRNGDKRALASNYHKSGNRTSRLTATHEELLHDVIIAYLSTPGTLPQTAGFNRYVDAFQQHATPELLGSCPVTIKTFRARCERIDNENLARKRGGKRLATKNAAPTAPETRSLPAARAFERAHIDHWLADIFVVVFAGTEHEYATRPSVTFLIDEATGYLLSISVTLKPPSRASWLRTLRDCVRKHRRLPEQIMSDWGSDFRSNAFYNLLSLYGIEKVQRPSGAPRWGATVERAFGQYEQQGLCQLPGYRPSQKDDRSVSRQMRAADNATIDLAALFFILERFTTEFYNAFPQGEATEAAQVLLQRKLQSYPHSGIQKVDSTEFRIETSVPEASARKRADTSRGFRIRGRYFSPDNPQLIGETALEVRSDPENHNLAFVQIGQQWHRCVHRHYSGMANRSAVDQTAEAIKYFEGSLSRKDLDLAKAASLGAIQRENEELRDKKAVDNHLPTKKSDQPLRPSELLSNRRKNGASDDSQ